jgi:hypothetical protein
MAVRRRRPLNPGRRMTAHDEPPPTDLEAPPDDDYIPDNVTSFTRRTPPGPTLEARANDPDVERQILGAAMTDAYALAVAVEQLAPGDFWTPAHETIFDAIIALDADRLPVGAVEVADYLNRHGDLKRAGGASYLAQLISSTVAGGASADYHATILKRHTLTRAAQSFAARFAQTVADPGVDPITAIGLAGLEVTTLRGLAAGTDDDHPSSWSPVNTVGLDLTAMTQPTILERSDGQAIIYPGANHAFVGESEGGKTWLALEACRQELLKERTVTYVDFEDRVQRVARRMIELGIPRDLLDARFRYVRPDVALTHVEQHHLMRSIDGTSLVIIDGVTEAMTMHGLSLTDNEDIAKFLHLLPRRIADTGSAVIQIDHVVKDEESRGRYALGGAHKLNGLDGAQYKIITTQPFGKGKRGHANVVVDKDREGSVREHTLGIKIGEFILDSTPLPDHPHDTVGPLRLILDPPDPGERTETGEFRPTHLMRKIADHLWVIPGLSTNQIMSAIPGNRRHKLDALRLLVTEGHVTTSDGPNRSKLHTVVIPFEES